MGYAVVGTEGLRFAPRARVSQLSIALLIRIGLVDEIPALHPPRRLAGEPDRLSISRSAFRALGCASANHSSERGRREKCSA